MTVNQMRIIPRYLKPRFLEDEGFYVCERPQVLKKMINKMGNRLIEEEKVLIHVISIISTFRYIITIFSTFTPNMFRE